MGTLIADARAELVAKRAEAAAVGIVVSETPVEELAAIDAVVELGKLSKAIGEVRAAEGRRRWWERD